MKIRSAEYVTSAPGLASAPELGNLPEFALVGRSNVGKSSFINCLVGRRNLARTSNTPGKTRLLNFYRVNERFVLVDLPGYGFAKVSKTEQESWRHNLEEFLSRREPLAGIVQLVDGRHGPQANDLEMFDWLADLERPVMVVLTKLDKQKKNKIAGVVSQTCRLMDIAPSELLLFSAADGTGRDEALAELESVIAAFEERAHMV